MLEAMLAIWLLRKPITSVAGRIGFVQQPVCWHRCYEYFLWNWYGFPGSYTAGYMATQIIGFTVAGIVAAFILREKAQTLRAPAQAAG